jgi:two-component system, cell cycle response regulator CtrA
MRVLLIEDSFVTARTIGKILSGQGFQVVTAEQGFEGIEFAKCGDYDIVLLDLQLPDMSGFDVLETLRKASIHTPIVIISGDAVVESKVRALRAGADDYLTKPFDKNELIGRVHAVMRRACSPHQSLITTGKITVNLDLKTVKVRGTPVHLTVKAYETLELLSLRKGTTLTKDVLMNRLYGGDNEPERKIIDVFICKLRKKLASATNGEHNIRTIWGTGYALFDPIEERASVISAEL